MSAGRGQATWSPAAKSGKDTEEEAVLCDRCSRQASLMGLRAGHRPSNTAVTVTVTGAGTREWGLSGAI